MLFYVVAPSGRKDLDYMTTSNAQSVTLTLPADITGNDLIRLLYIHYMASRACVAPAPTPASTPAPTPAPAVDTGDSPDDGDASAEIHNGFYIIPRAYDTWSAVTAVPVVAGTGYLECPNGLSVNANQASKTWNLDDTRGAFSSRDAAKLAVEAFTPPVGMSRRVLGLRILGRAEGTYSVIDACSFLFPGTARYLQHGGFVTSSASWDISRGRGAYKTLAFALRAVLSANAAACDSN